MPAGGPVLVLRALGLGDALTGVPALRGLRRRYAGRPLLLAGPEPVSSWLGRLGVVDGVVDTSGVAGWTGPPPGRGLGPHLAVNLHGRGPQSHRLLLAGEPDALLAFDCPEAGHRGETVWRPDEHEVDRWCRLVRDAGGECERADLRLPRPPVPRSGAVVVHPGAASGARRWPPERWAAVVRGLTRAGRPVVLTGSAGESRLCARIAQASGSLGGGRVRDLSGRLGLDDLAGLVAGAGLLLSGDTGVAHLATALGTPSVTLFGPTPPAWWGPAVDPDRHVAIYRGSAPGDPHADEPDPALVAVDVPSVLVAATSLLAGGGLTPPSRSPGGTSRPSTSARQAR